MGSAKAVDDLIELAGGAAEKGINDPENLLTEIDGYLAAFVRWEAEVSVRNPLGPDSPLNAEQKEDYRERLIVLEKVHTELLSLVEHSRDRIQLELSDVRRRSQALRAYIDQYPSRITIAGKREG